MARKKSTQESFDENVKKLAQKPPKKTAQKVKPKVKPKIKQPIPNHNHHVKRLEEYIPDEKLFALRSYYKSQLDEEDKGGFHAGSIVYRAIVDMEKRVSFYIDNTTTKTKKELKANLIKDLDGIKKRIKAL